MSHVWSISGSIKNLQPVGLKMDGNDYLLTQLEKQTPLIVFSFRAWVCH